MSSLYLVPLDISVEDGRPVIGRPHRFGNVEQSHHQAVQFDIVKGGDGFGLDLCLLARLISKM
jgi:hypothetical protein